MPRVLLVHLRLHFQLLLAPVWLWGWLIAGGGLRGGVVIGFVAFHAFLYSGATAFNSYYDRDVGPVGGLEHPPAVPDALLPFSLAVQLLGLVLCLVVNVTLALVYCVFMLLSVAYSHPRIRWKAHTFGSLLVVAFGQGVLAFAAAWAALRGTLEGIVSLPGVLGGAAAALLILALYPLTQLYQVDEDAARGDRTVALVLGPRGACALAAVCSLAGGVAMIAVVGARFGALDAALIAAGLAVQMVFIVRLGATVESAEPLRTYRRVMRLNRLSAAGMAGYLLARLSLM